MQLFRSLEVGVLELPAELALVQVQQQLLRGRLVDSLRRRSRVELGEALNELAIGIARLEQVLAGTSVQVGVEVVRRDTGEHVAQIRVGGNPRERIALQAIARPEQLR